jgi:amidase/6-aminohexanoate-cyclic-dimer hydrolase
MADRIGVAWRDKTEPGGAVMKDYGKHDALGLAALVKAREVSAQELLAEALARAEAAQASVNCFSSILPGHAKAQIAAGLGEGPFAGVPFALKDLGAALKGAPFTQGSRLYKDYVSPYDSVLTERYKRAGLVIFAQTTTPEFGGTTTTESVLFGKTRNPWNRDRIAGGSSGGAAAAVAAGVIPAAHASDGGGSIRVPAACCGLFGLKPSRGRMPMGPARTEGWGGFSINHAVTRSVRDSAALLDATHGVEPGSRYCAPAPERPFLQEVSRAPGKLRVALWRKAPNGTMPGPEAQAGLDAAVKLLLSLGHEVEEAEPAIDGPAVAATLAPVISAHIAANLDAVAEARGKPIQPDELEPITQAMTANGRALPATALARHDIVLQQAAIIFAQFMDRFDVTLSPTITRPPDPLGVLDLSPSDTGKWIQAVTTFAAHCGFYNQTGTPAMSVPLHWTADGLPLGIMFGAAYGHEATLYRLAGQLEQAAPWAARRPTA